MCSFEICLYKGWNSKYVQFKGAVRLSVPFQLKDIPQIKFFSRVFQKFGIKWLDSWGFQHLLEEYFPPDFINPSIRNTSRAFKPVFYIFSVSLYLSVILQDHQARRQRFNGLQRSRKENESCYCVAYTLLEFTHSLTHSHTSLWNFPCQFLPANQ